MSSKVSAFCMIVFLLLFTLSCAAAARPEPAAYSDHATPIKTQHLDVEAEKVQVEDSCEGIEEEECLMRRTLAAHIDYIYTQKSKP
ncbi:hypothetical protein QUC31_015118 [Theobroma cacao]|uniref:Phytosulfokine n=1 Tax=Theobroma cacao TaxID=3641 RepID=A0AB32VRX4_THECC|nr:PREDICTED: phytosulfokines [Theobroma cacao]WRX16466.1 Phytosulfokine - like 3 [Theobroma cacao]